jgi:hypothetical protein
MFASEIVGDGKLLTDEQWELIEPETIPLNLAYEIVVGGNSRKLF